MALWTAGGKQEYAARFPAKPMRDASSSVQPKGPLREPSAGMVGEVAYSLEALTRFSSGYIPNTNEPDALSGVEIGDVTGDGRKDLVITSAFTVYVFPQTPHGGFGSASIYDLFAPPRTYSYDFMVGSTLADMNRDGTLDIVITRAFSLVYILSDGAGGFRLQTHANSVLIATASAVILDIDGDGFLDAVTPVFLGHGQVAADSESRLVVAHGDGLGGVARFSRLSLADRYVRRIVSGDLNDDGRPDIATLESESMQMGAPTLVVRYHDGVGGFGSPVTLRQERFEALVTGDFNGDGRTDLATSGTPLEFGDLPIQTVGLYLQDVTGLISATPVSRGDLLYTNAMHGNDLDGDGRDDLITAQDGWGSIGFFLQRNGRLSDYKYHSAFLGTSAFGPDAIATGDVNGDGAEDIALAGGYPGVMVLAGRRVPYTGAASVPGAPTIGVATLPQDMPISAAVTFSPPASNGGEPITGYTVQAIPDGPRDRHGGEGGTSHIIDGLKNDTPYRFVVRAHNAAGESAPSSMSNVVTHRNLPVLSMQDDVLVSEGDSGTTTVRFEFTMGPALSGGAAFDVVMEPNAPEATATAGVDYVLRPPTRIVIPPGGRSATFDVQVIGDTVREGVFEQFYLKLANVTGALPPAINRARCRIWDNDKDPTALLPMANIAMAEGNAGTTPAVITFRLAAPLPHDVVFDAGTTDASAIAGADYVARQATGLRIPAGQTSVDFVVDLIGDLVSEGDDYFYVSTSNEVGASVGTSLFVTIVDDETLPTVSIADAMVIEGDSNSTNIAFTATLSSPAPHGGSYVEFVVEDAEANGVSAVAEKDYSVNPVTGIIIRPGQTTATLNIKILGDTIPEADELFRVRLRNVARAVPVIVEAHGLIIDNDRRFTRSAVTGGKVAPQVQRRVTSAKAMNKAATPLGSSATIGSDR